jgi:hypothetical protein
MLLSLGRYVLLGMVAALALATGGALAPPRATAQPKPTMVIIPSSGPCDAAVEVRGRGFPPASGPLDYVVLYLVQPGTADVNADSLSSAYVEPDGTFSEWVGLRERGCEAAALDSQAEQPARYLLAAAARRPDTSVEPGGRIPGIMAVAQYTYTTTTPPPPPVMAISPPGGPCDATVEITGRDFPASTAIHLDVAGGGGEATLGRLASLTTEPSGGFALTVSLGTLGCEGAQWIEGLGAGPNEFWIFADFEERPVVPGQQGIPNILTRTAYTYTTIHVGPAALPLTGHGPSPSPSPPSLFPLIGLLGGIGLTLMVVSLYVRRIRT